MTRRRQPAAADAAPPARSVATDATVRRLDSLLARGREAELLDAIRDLAKRSGGVSRVAEQADLNRTFLYRMLSPAGNPEMRTIAAVLRVMGLRLSICPLAEPAKRTSRAAPTRAHP